MYQNWRWCSIYDLYQSSDIYRLSVMDEYTFTDAAVDVVGNEDPTPASLTWTVDTTAPDTIIDSAIDGNNQLGGTPRDLPVNAQPDIRLLHIREFVIHDNICATLHAIFNKCLYFGSLLFCYLCHKFSSASPFWLK